MLHKTMIALAAGSGLMLAGTPAVAKPTGGIWSDNSPKGTTKSKPADDKTEKATPADPTPGEPAAAANADANVDESANSQARENSQGPANANIRALEQANENSVLADGAVASTALPGLTTGLTVNTSGGTSLGTVSQVVTGADGSIRAVIVTGTDGKTYRLMPSQLSISGGVVTTTQTDIGG